MTYLPLLLGQAFPNIQGIPDTLPLGEEIEPIWVYGCELVAVYRIRIRIHNMVRLKRPPALLDRGQLLH